MKLTIKKASGTVLVKDFKDSDVASAKANGWKEIEKPKAKPKAKKKSAK